MAHIRIGRAHLAVVVLLAATACSSETNPITAARALPTAQSLREEDANPVVQSLTGHWEVVGGLGNLNKISVNALKHLDGTVTGKFQFEQFNPDKELTVVAHGDILCLTVDGNTARVAGSGEGRFADGTITEGYAFLTAIDNGEGSNDPPDRSSALLTTTNGPRALSHCDAPLIIDSRIFTVQRGNVQVRS